MHHCVAVESMSDVEFLPRFVAFQGSFQLALSMSKCEPQEYAGGNGQRAFRKGG